MTLADFRAVVSVLLAVAFVAQAVAIVLGVVYFRRLVVKFGVFLDMAAKHGALTDDKAKSYTDAIIGEIKKLPPLTATKVLEAQAHIGIPEPPAKPPSNPGLDIPTPPPLPGKPLLVLAASLICLGLTASAHTPKDIPMSEEKSGAAALRRENYVKAEHLFARAGDDLGQAEALIDQKRYDEAKLICERHPTDGKAKLFLALIACKNGNRADAERLLQEAKELGNRPAEQLLKVGNWWEVVTCVRGSV